MAIDHFKKHAYQTNKVDWNFNILFNDQPQVAQTAKMYVQALSHPGLYPPIPAKWLHATILRIGLVDDYTKDELLAVTKQLPVYQSLTDHLRVVSETQKLKLLKIKHRLGSFGK